MKKHLTHDMQGNWISPLEIKSKAKPRIIVMSDQMKQYILDRDRLLWKNGDKQTKLELKNKYGV